MPALQLRTVTRTQGNNTTLEDGTVSPPQKILEQRPAVESLVAARTHDLTA